MNTHDDKSPLCDLDEFETNKDQTIGSLIARAAALIAKRMDGQTGADDVTKFGGAPKYAERAQGEAGRYF